MKYSLGISNFLEVISSSMLDTYQPGEFMTWEVHDIVQETEIKTIPKKKKCKKAKWLSEEALQIAVKEEKRKTMEKRKDVSV